MTQSFMSSGLSLDDENLGTLIDSIHFLLDNFFDQNKPLLEANEPISALISIVEKQRTLFQEKSAEILHVSVESLLKYAIFQCISPIRFKNSNDEMYILSKQFIMLLSSIILIYPINNFSIFLNHFFDSFNKIIYNKDFVIPNATNVNTIINYEDYKGIRFTIIEVFLQILINLISQTANDSYDLLALMYDCLFSFDDQPQIQYLALKCLSRSYPYSISNSLIQVRIIISFMHTMSDSINKNGNKESSRLFNLVSLAYYNSDKYATLALKNALSSLPNNIIAFLGREVLGCLIYLPKYQDYKVINEVFNIVKIYLESDRANCRPLGSLVLFLFKDFFQNESFVNLCKKISLFDDHFQKQLIKNYIDVKVCNPEMIPAIMSIYPQLLVDYEELLNSKFYNENKPNSLFYKNIPDPIFFQICALLAKEKNPDQLGLTKEMIEYLEKKIKKGELPEGHLLSPIMRLASDALIPHLPEYDLDTTYNAIFVNRIHIDDETKSILITMAMTTKPFPLIPYFIIAYKSDKNELLKDFLMKAANPQLDDKNNDDYSAYEHKIFIDAIAKLFHDNIEQVLPEDIILTLLKRNMIQSVSFIGYNETTFPLCIKQIFEIIKTEPGFCSEAAFCALKNIPKNVLNTNININRFTFSSGLFHIVSSKEVKPKHPILNIGIRENRFMSLIKYLISKPAISLLKENYGNNASDAQTFSSILNLLKDSIIPILLKDIDEKSLNELTLFSNYPPRQIAQIDCTSDDFILTRNNFIASSITDAFTYLLAYCNQSAIAASLHFLINLTGKQPTYLVQKFASKISSNLFLYLGHPKAEIKTNSMKGLFVIASALGSKNKDKNEMIKDSWCKNFQLTIYHFSLIMKGKSIFQMKMVIQSLHNALEQLAPILPKSYPKIASIIDLAIKEENLTKKCLSFWISFLEIVSNSVETIEHLFGHIVTQVLPFLDKYPDLVKKILEILIFDKKSITHSHFPEIAHISDFYEKSELEKEKKELIEEIKKISWKDQIKILIDQLEQASLTFRKQLLKQLLMLLKEHADDILNDESNNTSNCSSFSQLLVQSLWNNISHETNRELLSLYGRCMSMLPYIRETDDQESENTTKKDKVEIIICMIKDYLIKVLEDSSNSAYHDHAAYAIQELLKLLIKEPSYDEDIKPKLPLKSENTQIGNLGKIPENIWTVIEPFLNSKFSYNSIEPLNTEYSPVIQFPNVSNFNNWLSSWTKIMFSVSLSNKGDVSADSEIFICCGTVLCDSPALIKFILPYLIMFNSKNKFFLACLRSEWHEIYNILKNNNDKKQMDNKQVARKQNQNLNRILLAKSAMRLFFQLFDVLNKWRIAAGSTHDRGQKWISLNIATDDTLADAAYECDLYLRSLHHLEFHIVENKSLTENLPFLYKIYQNIDDSDMKKVISEALLNQDLNDTKSENQNLVIDESMSANEISFLAREQDTNVVISFIQNILHNGRAERALVDATTFRKKILLENRRNVKLDAIITSAAIKLTQWDDISSISDEYEPIASQGDYSFNFYLNSKNYSNVDFDSLIEISTGKLLLFLRGKKLENFSKELKNIRALLSLKLSAVSMMTSYHRLISILSQFRVFEEVEDFKNQKFLGKNENNKKFCFGDWIKQAELSVDDVEFVTSVRCALISLESATTEKEQEEKSNNLSNQWLNLSKMCRKSESLFRAEMFVSRARHLTTSPERCNYEIAKVAYAKNRKDQAISLIKSIQMQISKIIEPMTSKNSSTNSTSPLISRSSSSTSASSTDENKIIDLQELFGKVIYTRAKWSEEMNSENSNTIFSMYQESAERQEKAIKNQDKMNPIMNNLKNKIENPKNAIYNAAKAYFSLGALADQRAISYIQFLTETTDIGTKKPRPFKFFNQMTASDTKEFLLQMITKALDNYLQCIIYSPAFSYEVVPRILLLFFDIGRYFIPEEDDKKSGSTLNLSANQKAAVHQAMRESLLSKVDKVKASVWLNALTQLTSRIEQPKGLEDVLLNLIKLSAVSYKEPSLWNLISIKNSNVPTRKPKWDMIIDFIRRSLPKDQQNQFDKKANDFALISHYIIELCTINPGASKSHTTKASHFCPKLVSNLSNCDIIMPLLSTLTVNLDPSNNNQNSPNQIKIVEMGSKIVVLTSLQKPRKVEFKGTNGTTYHYLCKKDDDLRKDMRMMEFATFINRILTNNRQCRQKNLKMVTYAVIVLNEQCGMMEWVENTKSFRSIISKMLEFKGIKIDYGEVKKLYIDTEKPTPDQIRQRLYNFENHLLKMFPPVLHSWFSSHFKDISTWFNSRLLYTRSAALWSMVGYIIGLGDRHSENILLNIKTGSCVHVDFNLLFDRGKSLPIPEIVPFRLTQNIVDGMGVMGTQGPFIETSILIMDTFRGKKEKLISVLQTFIHDPLIEWRKQSKAVTESYAKMTLKEVERRITGTDEARSTMLSSECVVKSLISQAADVRNLVLMYVGWQSYL